MTGSTAPAARTATAAGRTARRLAWFALGVFCVTFTGLEVVNHGSGAAMAAVLFAGAPDLARILHGRGETVVRLVHSPWPPLAVLVGYTVTPVVWVPIFAAGLGWLAHGAFARAVGCAVRSPGGHRRG